MNDPITTLQALIDSEANVNLQSETRGTVGWHIWDSAADEEPQIHGSAETVAGAIEALAEAACRDDQNSNFARFHRGEINYFRCGICGKPCFGVEPVMDAECGECCPEHFEE